MTKNKLEGDFYDLERHSKYIQYKEYEGSSLNPSRSLNRDIFDARYRCTSLGDPSFTLGLCHDHETMLQAAREGQETLSEQASSSTSSTRSCPEAGETDKSIKGHGTFALVDVSSIMQLLADTSGDALSSQVRERVIHIHFPPPPPLSPLLPLGCESTVPGEATRVSEAGHHQRSPFLPFPLICSSHLQRENGEKVTSLTDTFSRRSDPAPATSIPFFPAGYS